MRLILIFPALAVSTATFAAEPDACFVNAAAKYNLDPKLLWSIAMVESGGRTDALGQNFAKPAADAVPDARGKLPKGRLLSEDLGVMQINSGWLPTLAKYGITRDRLLKERCLNIEVGAWILAGVVARLGPRWNAVGAYNSACIQLKGADCEASRKRYTDKVWSWYARSQPAAATQYIPQGQPTQLAQNSKPRMPAIAVIEEESN